MKLPHLPKNALPAIAVVVGITAALSDFGRRSAAAARAETTKVAVGSPAAQRSAAPVAAPLIDLPAEEEDTPAQSISGSVLEQVDVEKYSYLRLGEKGSPGTWAAVPRTSSHLGERVTVTSAEVMSDFRSTSLGRTFDTIYFGLLKGSTAGTESLANEPGQAAPAVAQNGPGLSPHAGAGPGADRVPVGQVKRASGPLARTVAELNGARAEDSGTKARVRGVIVKSTSGVLGRTFLHVRDGSGDAKTGSNDLTVTSAGDAKVGSQVELEGTLVVDQDFGSGYRYHVLLADATFVAE